MKDEASLFWFRQDLRIDDNPGLAAALDRGGPVIPLYIWDPGGEGEWPPGAASRWWLHKSLCSLDRELQAKGSRLVIRRGRSLETLLEVSEETGANAVFCNRRYEPAAIRMETEIRAGLERRGVAFERFNGTLLFEPEEVQTKAGDPFQVFTPFWKACMALPGRRRPRRAPNKLVAPATWPPGDPAAALDLGSRTDWADKIRGTWSPGSAGGKAELRRFLAKSLFSYEGARDRPGLRGTSHLSPHLHFGEISIHRVWRAVQERAAQEASKGRKRAFATAASYLRQLGWREFTHHTLFYFPHTADRPLRPKFEKFPWKRDKKALQAWQSGRTGYPIVDAGMRELRRTGWMHNRARMIVASFLVKDLLLPWREGARWFWDALVDADLANNTMGWQWSAGCGADAAPYFRIFNPVSQGRRFDPKGVYVRHWVPELANLPDKWIHCPWEAPREVLQAAGVKLGKTYPGPIVDHAQARSRALEAFGLIKKA